MVVLAFLGFREQRALPLNDKLLHFLCFMIATGVFYFIVDIEEYVLLRVSIQRCLTNNGLSHSLAQRVPIARNARRIWFWRYFNLIFTFIICCFCGGILSEVVQSLLPVR